jgi:hypothetical protein
LNEGAGVRWLRGGRDEAAGLGGMVALHPMAGRRGGAHVWDLDQKTARGRDSMNVAERIRAATRSEGGAMLSKVKTLSGYKLEARDGEIGNVKEFYFDDRHWTVRYLVAETGSWLTGRKVLISPYALRGVNKVEKSLSVDLTRKQIEDSPPLESHKPVSQQFEDDYYGYYGWPLYWSGAAAWGTTAIPHRDPKSVARHEREAKSWDRHLRSTAEVTGYDIQALDGEIGHVDDFVVDDASWQIRYLVVATTNWWPGRKVLVSPLWIDRVQWSDSKVFVHLSRETIQNSPEYSEEALLTREYEIGMHQHYGRKGYWMDVLPER